MKFINGDAACIHGNLQTGSVYTSESGEWKLAGFEVLSSVKDDEPFIYRYGSLLPDAGRYAAPEVGKGGWGALARYLNLVIYGKRVLLMGFVYDSQAIHVTDSWGFGKLIYEAFNGPISGTEVLAQPKKIPSEMSASYKRLITANPKTRLSVSDFLAQGVRSTSFFDTPLIHISEFIENISVKDAEEREAFIDELERTTDDYPEQFYKMKILPELLKSVEYGGGGPKVFDAVLRIGEKCSDEEWEASITPAVVRLFSLPDRATRVFLLDNLPRIIDHLSKPVVNNKIFPDMLTGFADSAPIVREQSVKAVLVVIGKLSDRNINGDLLKALAKTQNDPEPGIRTNTTICLGKIARNLGENTRQKVLVAAFTRSLRDPFIHARKASLLALAATNDIFNEADCASKVVPAISPSLVDKEKIVREEAFKCLEVYLSRIKSLTANYPDTVLPDPSTQAGSSSGTSTPTASTAAVSAAADWTGWAISSFTKKIASTAVSGEMGVGGTPPVERPSSTPSVVLRPKLPAPATKPVSTPAAPVKSSQPAGFLVDDDDELEGWGNGGDQDDEDDNLSFSTPKTSSQATRSSTSSDAHTHANKIPLAGTASAKASSFGPKPFSLNKNKTEEVDFEELLGAKKKASSVLGGAGAGKGLAGVKKAPASSSGAGSAVKKTVPGSIVGAGAIKKPLSGLNKKGGDVKKGAAAGWGLDDDDWGDAWG